MISLKKTIEAYDYRSMSEAALESYTTAIASLEKNVIGVDRDGVNAFRAQMLALRDRLSNASLTPPALRTVTEDLDSGLRQYRSEIETLLKESSHDLKDVVSVLAETTESLGQRESQYGNQLSRISGGLEAISQIDNLAIVRVTLNRQVSELRSCIAAMARDHETAVAELQKEIVNFQKRLEKVQIEAFSDPLTGLANRRRCTREISSRILSGKPFGILLFDMNKFKSVNDTLGHAAGDAVLRAVSERLSESTTREDLVCRWGGDEFVIVRDGDTGDLAAAAQEIRSRLSGAEFVIRVDGVEHKVALGAEVGWSAFLEKDLPEDLVARADKMLYRAKDPRQGTEPADLGHDPATGLPNPGELERRIAEIGSDRSSWYLGCFAIAAAAKIDNHYGYSATDVLLPVLRDEILNSKFAGKLFRGRGASIIALVNQPGGASALGEDLNRISSLALEKRLKHKRRASIMPVEVAAALVPLDSADAVKQVHEFVDKNRAVKKAPAAV